MNRLLNLKTYVSDQRYKYLWLQLIILIVSAAALWSYAPSSFHPNLPNDANSAYYISYARNLNRYPLGVTRGLNVDLVESDGKFLHASDVLQTQYKTHPPLLTWTTAFFYSINSSIRFARGASIFGSLLLILGLGYLVFQVSHSLFAVCLVPLFLFANRIFVEHGVVVNFEPLCAGISIFLYSVFNSRNSTHDTRVNWLGYLVLFFSLLSDWPAYLVVPGVFYLEWSRGGLKSLFRVSIFSLVVLASLCLYYAISGRQPNLVSDLTGAVLNTHRKTEMMIYHPWPDAFARMYQSFEYNFGKFYIYFVVPALCLLLLCRRDRKFPWSIVLFLLLGATLNMVLFKQWAVDHRFWSYYYLAPTTLLLILAIHEVLNRVSVDWFRWVIQLCVVFVLITKSHSRVEETKQAVRQTPEYLDEIQKVKDSNQLSLVSSGPEPYFGNGYVERYYFDKQLDVLSSNMNSANTKQVWAIVDSSELLTCEPKAIKLYSWEILVNLRGCPKGGTQVSR